MAEDTHQITGARAVSDALDAHLSLTLLLVQSGDLPEPIQRAVVARAIAAGVPIREASENDLRRMSRSDPPARILALHGRNPAADLGEVMHTGGAVWLLAGVEYPSNVGTLIRTVEVAGAAAVVVDAPSFSRPQRLRSLRVAMRADRFMPVLWRTTEETLRFARQAERRIIAVEDTGETAPWHIDLTGPVLQVVGAERHGIPPETLERCDAVVRLPMPGFVPSYNVQAAAAAIAAERLRQLETR